MWRTDLTYFFVKGWGWYYVGGVLDDYGRYLICCEVFGDMTGSSMSELVQRAVERTAMLNVPVEHKVKLISDNGGGYLSRAFNDYLAIPRHSPHPCRTLSSSDTRQDGAAEPNGQG